MTATKTKRTHWPVTVTVEVDSCELEDAGYHHEDDCPATPAPTAALEQAVQALHELAHPNGALFAETCLAQPCWNLYGGGL